MKRLTVLFVTTLILTTGVSMAESRTEQEVRQLILDDLVYLNKNLVTRAEETSKHGSLEFWSSGGMLQDVPPGQISKFKWVNVKAKHIKVISLVEGEAAVAMYYSEGAMKPENAAAVTNYLTRVTQVFVKEDGKWKVRAAHWSPIVGGSGTSRTTVED